MYVCMYVCTEKIKLRNKKQKNVSKSKELNECAYT